MTVTKRTAKKTVRGVEEWQTEVEDSVRALAKSWKKLERPIAKIEKILADAEVGGLIPADAALREAVGELRRVNDGCPLLAGPRQAGPCRPPLDRRSGRPTKPSKRRGRRE